MAGAGSIPGRDTFFSSGNYYITKMIYLYFFLQKSGPTMAGSAGTVATPLPTTWGVIKVVQSPVQNNGWRSKLRMAASSQPLIYNQLNKVGTSGRTAV